MISMTYQALQRLSKFNWFWGSILFKGELGIENYFLENMASNWNTYKSHAYQQKGWYLGLNKRGKPIKNVDLKRRAAIYFQVDCTRN